MTDQLCNILQTYLQSSLSAVDAAKQLRDTVEADEAVEDAAYALFNLVADQVRALTPDASQHEHLVSLLVALKSAETSARDWSELVPLGMVIRELWNISGPEKEDWPAINAFAARLAAGRVLDLDTFGIWTMRAALEGNTETTDREVAAALQWIRYAGSHMKKLSMEGTEATTATKGGPRWSGQGGYNKERWAFWSQRLTEVAAEGSATDTASQKAAVEAVKEILKLN
ncbi:hypothetical protein CYLTODRAFT_419868 [Cylindrobasidium torrendii FP15055 ss-10]|uniref:Uncharacterized protein n=1 Tax=Cylindrobasidium torrendii FP15055 ss-10 TaxID=1314674 RepID=A0A0D7BJJ0_9AGAR|nr:hypothetical protein CYLTODRAFT_419868 [Cylindrobasidium torrendii FP15055 ss-10]